MDRPSRLPLDCLRCENRGVIALDDDKALACPLCNNWCMLCLEGVPTFVPIIRPYRGSLIAGMRPTIDGERLFEGYACDYHKATLKSYSSIAPANRTSQCRGVSSWCVMAMARRRTGRSLRTRPGKPLPPIDTRPMGRSSIPVQQSLLRGSYADYETFTIIIRVDKA